jgi:LacI family transcriptional regulator
MAKLNPANVRDVGKDAGVSHITVSRALRNDPKVKPETREKVLSSARKLGYVPNPLVNAYASHIRRKRGLSPTCNLAWLTGTPEHHSANYFPWVRPYLNGAMRRAKELGFTLDTNLEVYDLQPATVLRILTSRGIRGVILPNIHYYGSEFQGSDQIAVVSIGNSPGHLPVHTVAPNGFANVGIALSNLQSMGYKRIGFCEHLQAGIQGLGIFEGSYLYHQRKLKSRDRIPTLTQLQVSKVEPSGQQSFVRWLDQYKPDAILTTFVQIRDWIAHMSDEAVRSILVAHVGLSEDDPGWTGVDVRAEVIGSGAIDLLAAHINRNEYGIPEFPKNMIVTGTWQLQKGKAIGVCR